MQGFYVSVTTAGNWLPGQQRTYYLQSNFAFPALAPSKVCFGTHERPSHADCDAVAGPICSWGGYPPLLPRSTPPTR